MKTVYQVAWGCDNGDTGILYFPVLYYGDAVLRFSEKIVTMDKDDQISAAWACLTLVKPEIQSIATWTKTSDERPTHEGYVTAEEAATKFTWA